MSDDGNNSLVKLDSEEEGYVQVAFTTLEITDLQSGTDESDAFSEASAVSHSSENLREDTTILTQVATESLDGTGEQYRLVEELDALLPRDLKEKLLKLKPCNREHIVLSVCSYPWYRSEGATGARAEAGRAAGTRKHREGAEQMLKVLGAIGKGTPDRPKLPKGAAAQ